MSLFREVDNEVAIIVDRGVYRQVALYTRDGYLYAKAHGGFVKLYADGATTRPNCRLETITFDGMLCRDPLGRLCTDAVAKAVPLPTPDTQRLLGVIAP